MLKDYEKYHGVVLRSLITDFEGGLHVQAKDVHGIINCFQVNQTIGLMIKHSAKRMPPYVFTFTQDNLIEFELLADASQNSFTALVCGWDGFLTLSQREMSELSYNKSSDSALSIHVSRRKRGMYSVGGCNKLQSSKPRGFSPEFLQALQK